MQQDRFRIHQEGLVARQYKVLSPSDLDVLWSRWQQGDTAVQISVRLGCNKSTVAWHIERTGGLRPRERRRAERTLTAADREEISRGIAAGESGRAIARRLGRAPSTVSREWRRNARTRETYRASRADQAAWDRARRPKPCRLAQHPRLRQLVEQKLRADWAPQQIAQ